MPSQLNDFQYWNVAYQEYKEVLPITPLGGYPPLASFEIPVIFNSKFLIAKTISTIPQGKRWNWAGDIKASQFFPNSTVNNQATEIATFDLSLNSSKLLVLPDLASEYSLILSGAYWLRNLELIIYEFTG